MKLNWLNESQLPSHFLVEYLHTQLYTFYFAFKFDNATITVGKDNDTLSVQYIKDIHRMKLVTQVDKLKINCLLNILCI